MWSQSKICYNLDINKKLELKSYCFDPSHFSICFIEVYRGLCRLWLAFNLKQIQGSSNVAQKTDFLLQYCKIYSRDAGALYRLTQKLKLQTVQRIYPISTYWLVSYHFFILPLDQASLAGLLGRTSKILLKSQATEKLAELLNPHAQENPS